MVCTARICRRPVVDDQCVDPAVVVEVPGRQPAPDDRLSERLAQRVALVGEANSAPGAQIQVIDVAVGDQQVEPAIVVVRPLGTESTENAIRSIVLLGNPRFRCR